jgi:hypothetical protein
MTQERNALGLLLVVLHALCATSGAAAAAQISAEADAHVSEVIAVLQREWLYRDRIDWKTFRRRVLEEARTAQTIPDTYGAIRLALSLLGDKHSSYVPVTGDTIFNPQSPTVWRLLPAGLAWPSPA